MELDTSETKKAATSSLRREFVTLLLIVSVALTFALFVRLCVAQAYEIRGSSMEPTYHNGDRVILLKIAPSIIPVSRHDIVIFSHPGQAERFLVKRVVAVGGDHVRIMDGRVYVNGSQADLFLPGVRPGTYGSWIVPADSYFVMGDNRANSMDSRDFGPISHHLIEGKVWFRWWPIAGL